MESQDQIYHRVPGEQGALQSYERTLHLLIYKDMLRWISRQSSLSLVPLGCKGAEHRQTVHKSSAWRVLSVLLISYLGSLWNAIFLDLCHHECIRHVSSRVLPIVYGRRA